MLYFIVQADNNNTEVKFESYELKILLDTIEHQKEICKKNEKNNYIVFTPNSGPIKIKPIIKSPMFIINVIVETESGIKLLRTIAKAAPLPTETWLGNIKKNTAAATMAVPTVIIANSLIVLQNFMSFSS